MISLYMLLGKDIRTALEENQCKAFKSPNEWIHRYINSSTIDIHMGSYHSTLQKEE